MIFTTLTLFQVVWGAVAPLIGVQPLPQKPDAPIKSKQAGKKGINKKETPGMLSLSFFNPVALLLPVEVYLFPIPSLCFFKKNTIIYITCFGLVACQSIRSAKETE